MNNYETAVFVSYAWGGESEIIVNNLEEAFAKHGIRIERDKKVLDYKGSIEAFEQRIGQGQYVILVISDKYLRSEHCMYELVEVDKNRNLRDRIFPIVLSDAHIYKATDRLEYIKYWEEQIEQLDQSMRTVKKLSNLSGITNDLDKYESIRASFAHLTNLLRDLNTLTPEMHAANDFSIVIDAIERAMAADKGPIDLPPKNSGTSELSRGKGAIAADELLEDGSSIFLDREENFAELQKSVLATPRKKIVTLVGPAGIGKTALVSRIYADIKRQGVFEKVKKVDCTGLKDQKLSLLSVHLANLLEDDEKQAFVAMFNNPAIELDEKLQQLLVGFQNTSAFVWLDNFEALQDGSGKLISEGHERFFEKFLTLQSKLQLILTSRLPLALPEKFAIHKIFLNTGLPESDAISLLKSLWESEEMPDLATLKMIANKTLGNPLCLIHAVNLINENPIIDISVLLQGKLIDSMARIFDQEYQMLDQASLLVMQALSIFHRAEPQDAIRYLIGSMSPGWEDALNYLVRARLISYNKSEKKFELHLLFRDWVHNKLPADLKKELHRRAAAYYSKKLSVEDPGLDFMNWYQLEGDAWQEDILEWLSQLALSEDIQNAQLAICSKYFKASTWWDYYVPFTFCDRFVDFLKTTQAYTDDETVNLLCQFHTNWPHTRYYKISPQFNNLVNAKQALLQLWSLHCGGNIAELKTERLLLRYGIDWYLGIINNHLGDQDADYYYQESIDIVSGYLDEDSLWLNSYTLVNMADRQLALGNYLQARDYILEIWQIAADKDYEVLSLACRLLGDFFWRQKAYKEAWHAYQVATLYAYMILGEPVPPDAFTISVYEEIQERFDDRLLETAVDKLDIVNVCRMTREFWFEYWHDSGENYEMPDLPDDQRLLTWLNASKLADINTYMFPPIPNERDEEYAAMTKKIGKQMIPKADRMVAALQDTARNFLNKEN